MVRIFLSGDVMTGRGIDQILAQPGNPALRELHVKDARAYVRLAEAINGPIPHPAEASWIWGDALGELERLRPETRIINLETAVTLSDEYWTGKGIHYRMHPGNIGCLRVAAIDACALANNHVLDFGYTGLAETLDTLQTAGLQTAGAGWDIVRARRPAVIKLASGGRISLVSVGMASSGIPRAWGASIESPGVNFVAKLSEAAATEIVERVRATKRRGDIAIVSIHWGSNWGYEVTPDQVQFAHLLIEGGVDVVHGHSSHHPRPIEVYRDRLILYGCGDLINDYEGIGGHEELRGDLALLYLPALESATGELLELRMLPMQIRRMSLHRVAPADLQWAGNMLNEISSSFGSLVRIAPDRSLVLDRWP